jgi:NAD(P)-dependent dehydrogenase (short-subunit alcohol dehydrogenase family)
VDRTILITGATDGLGRELAQRAHGDGWRVLAHGRDRERLARLAAELPGAEPLPADLARLADVRALADAVATATARLDVLVNNAGIGSTGADGRERREVSSDGHELRFAVNYLAGYALTQRLLDLLRASAPARIVNVASAGQTAIDFDDVMLERGYDGTRAYCQSKLAQVMFTIDLAAALDPAAVTVNALHPATYMPTKMVRESGATPVSTLEQGVEATWRLVADAALDGVSGRYFNGTRAGSPDAQALDPEARWRLRELSERLT